MGKEKLIEAEGKVIEAVRTKFLVQLDEVDQIVTCHPAGKLRKHYIRIIPGDRVKVELTPYDPTKGRITYRYK